MGVLAISLGRTEEEELAEGGDQLPVGHEDVHVCLLPITCTQSVKN